MPDSVDLDPHGKFHQWYSLQRNFAGGSCCNNKDCRPAKDFRVLHNGVVFTLYDGRDIFVPMPQVKTITPDGQPHYCGYWSDTHSLEVPVCGFIPGIS